MKSYQAYFSLKPWPDLKQTLQTEFPQISFSVPSSFDKKTITEECPTDTDFIIGHQVSKKLLKKCQNLKAIIVPWTGVDSLDFELLRKYPDITVVNSHGNAETVAEYAVMLLLAAAKRINFYHLKAKKGEAMPIRFKHRSINISGKTALFLGTGAIGTATARMLKQGFNITCWGIKNNPKNLTKEQCTIFQNVGSTNDMIDMVKAVDIVISSLPLTDGTENLLDHQFFQNMKEKAIFVNVGRGQTIVQDALYEVLEQEQIFAAGIDPVWQYQSIDQEADEAYYPWTKPFQQLDNIVLSAHRAAITYDNDDFLEDIVRDLKRLCEKKEPLNKVNLEQEY